MSDAITLTMLVSGSVWERESTKTKSTVLHVTNEGLSEKLKTKFPCQVVFMTEEFKVLSQSVDQFLASRSFFSMDSRVEDLVASLSLKVEDIEPDGFDIDSQTISEDDDPLNQVSDSDDEDGDSVIIIDDEEEAVESAASSLRLNLGPHLYADVLQKNIVAYEESPFHTGDTLHKLVFSLSPDLTLEIIRSAFLITDPNSIQKFEVVSGYETTVIDVDAYVHTLLSADQGLAYGTVYLLTDGSFRNFESSVETHYEEVVEEEPAPAPKPEVGAQGITDATGGQGITVSNTLNVM